MNSWLDKNKWFVLAVVALLYLANATRYQHAYRTIFLDTWAGKTVLHSQMRRELTDKEFLGENQN